MYYVKTFILFYNHYFRKHSSNVTVSSGCITFAILISHPLGRLQLKKFKNSSQNILGMSMECITHIWSFSPFTTLLLLLNIKQSHQSKLKCVNIMCLWKLLLITAWKCKHNIMCFTSYKPCVKKRPKNTLNCNV